MPTGDSRQRRSRRWRPRPPTATWFGRFRRGPGIHLRIRRVAGERSTPGPKLIVNVPLGDPGDELFEFKAAGAGMNVIDRNERQQEFDYSDGETDATYQQVLVAISQGQKRQGAYQRKKQEYGQKMVDQHEWHPANAAV